jgi:hypothetical protein
MISSIGVIVPSAFDTCVIATRPCREAEQPSVLVHDQIATVVDGHHLESRALLLAEHLPGHDVGVVLDRRDDDLVARADGRAPEARRHEVDRSVAWRTNTISRREAALRWRWMRARALSYASVARSLSRCTPRGRSRCLACSTRSARRSPLCGF